jgi:CSLREA domain-containing protein
MSRPVIPRRPVGPQVVRTAGGEGEVGTGESRSTIPVGEVHLELYDPSGTMLRSSASHATNRETIAYSASNTAGAYRARVLGAAGQSDATAGYHLKIETVPFVEPVLLMNSANDIDDGTCNAALCSLREALNTHEVGLGTGVVDGEVELGLAIDSEWETELQVLATQTLAVSATGTATAASTWDARGGQLGHYQVRAANPVRRHLTRPSSERRTADPSRL